jgi:energy-coupling factor transporter ATP-binding protein EcfA2
MSRDTDNITLDDVRDYKSHTDAQQIRKTFGIAPFWSIEEQLEDYEHALPNSVIHTKDGDRWGHPGGTNWFVTGGKGSGKSTLALWLAAQLMDENDETVIWRGSQARSEWLPYRPWATLYLPSHCNAQARWVNEDVANRGEGEQADLREVVSEVYYYDGLRDLLGALDSHEFAVVYPDPLFRGCNEIMDESTYVQEPISYTPEPEAAEPDDVTPLVHWWVALCVARLEGWGDLMDWTSLIFDEVADLLPQSARANRNQTYQKVEVMRKIMADSRKYRFSLFCFGHDEPNIHSKIRRTFQWRVSTPDDTGNPTCTGSAKVPVGFSRIPMRANMLATKDPGFGICWTSTSFTRFTWSDVPDLVPDRDRLLKVELDTANIRARDTDSQRATPGNAGSQPEGVADDD